MRDDLYFIPLIATALRQPDTRSALSAAFAEIEKRREEPRYRDGYRQFLRFMTVVRRTVEDGEHASASPSATPEIRRPRFIELRLERDKIEIAAWRLTHRATVHTVSDVRPGAYRLRLDTGRVLWTAELSSKELLWSHAFRGQALPLAARTDAVNRRPTLEATALEGVAVIRVYPGIEAGAITVSVQRWGGDRA
jgi:hypothetical protein